jgi:NADPH:quinone reductase-like Zn-dependent oxidoreductase
MSLNPVDWKVVNGNLKFVTGNKFPKMTGIEGAGTIAETGAGVCAFNKGQKVFVALDYNGGICAEYACVPVSKVMPLPDGIGFEEASTMAVAGITALQGLRDKGKIKKGMEVLINGASGGVGTYTIQVAKYFGAEVTAVCSSKNFDLVRSLGADYTIDYNRGDFTGSEKKYHLVFDAVGNRNFWQVKKILHKKGIYVNICPSLLLMISSVITKLRPGKKSFGFMLKPDLSDLKKVMEMILNKDIKVVIDRVYSFDDVAKAYEYSRSGRARGKIVIILKQPVVSPAEFC